MNMTHSDELSTCSEKSSREIFSLAVIVLNDFVFIYFIKAKAAIFSFQVELFCNQGLNTCLEYIDNII